MPNIVYIRQRVEDISEVLREIPEGLKRSDLASLAREVLEAVSEIIDFLQLERQVSSIHFIDFDALNRAATILDTAELGEPFIVSENRTIYPRVLIDELKGRIGQLQMEASTLDAETILSAIDFPINRRLEEILICAARSPQRIESLLDLVKSKTQLLSDRQVAAIWSQVQREFSEERVSGRLIRDQEIVPENFLDYDNANAAKEKLAQFVVEIKPKLLVRMFSRRIFTSPIESPSVARILSWMREENTTALKEIDLVRVKSIARIAYLWGEYLHLNMDALSEITGILEGSRIFSGSEYREASEELRPADNRDRILLHELSTLLRTVEFVPAIKSEVENALLQFKISTEIRAPENIQTMKDRNEIRLQRDVCAFFAERGIFS
jgi:hypothetical protein